MLCQNTLLYLIFYMYIGVFLQIDLINNKNIRKQDTLQLHENKNEILSYSCPIMLLNSLKYYTEHTRCQFYTLLYIRANLVGCFSVLFVFFEKQNILRMYQKCKIYNIKELPIKYEKVFHIISYTIICPYNGECVKHLSL